MSYNEDLRALLLNALESGQQATTPTESEAAKDFGDFLRANLDSNPAQSFADFIHAQLNNDQEK